jgi:hypothetical protein
MDHFCKVIMPPYHTAYADKDLQGFRSHVRYSVFKDRVVVNAFRMAESGRGT